VPPAREEKAERRISNGKWRARWIRVSEYGGESLSYYLITIKLLLDKATILWQDDAMKRREDNRSIATRILQAITRGLIIAALGLAAVFGDIGTSARALGVLGALAITGTAVVVSDYATTAERRRCEEERRSVALEDRKVDEFVAEMAATPLVTDMAQNQPTDIELCFVRLVNEQRQRSVGTDRSVGRRG
jgi:hypothetical protein